jgi:hypothetical protein
VAVERVWDEEDGEILFRHVRWNGKPRATGDLWVTADGFDWRRGKATVGWRDVEAFDVLRAGTWETEGGRSLSMRDGDDPRMLGSDVIGALDSVAAARYRGARTHLIVETRRHVHVFTSGERVKRVRQVLLPAIHFYAV